MSIIENFAALSVQEQREFAEAFVKTINTENIFTDITDFKVVGVEADEMTGGLAISLEPEDYIEISREATWTCGDRDEAYSPEDPDFAESSYEAAKAAFKTLVVENLEGYYASLEVDDVDVEDRVDVDVDSISDEDDGIGSYEYWGQVGYDSRPYCEVEGTIVHACSVYCTLYVEAADVIPTETEEN